MAFVGGRMQGGVPVVVPGQQQVTGELLDWNLVELAGFRRRVDGGEPAFAGEHKIVVAQKRRRNLLEVPGNGGRVENRVAGARRFPQGRLSQKRGRHLVQVAVEGANVQDGFAAEILLGEIFGREVLRRNPIERSVFDGLVQERVADIGPPENDLGRQEPRRKLVQVTMGGGEMKDANPGVAANRQGFLRQAGGGDLIQVATDGRVVERRVARVVLECQVFAREGGGRQVAQPAALSGDVKRGVPRGIAGRQPFGGKGRGGQTGKGAVPNGGIQIDVFHLAHPRGNATRPARQPNLWRSFTQGPEGRGPGAPHGFGLPRRGTKTESGVMNETDPKVAAPTVSAKAAAQPKDAILLVDDEAALLEVFSAALSPLFDVSTASNARDADFQLQKKNFKVVVADHLMPGGNGMNFLVRAREEFPHMQRILVTGYMKPEMLLRSVNEAALFRYLLKPVAMTELIKVVQDAARAYNASVAAKN